MASAIAPAFVSPNIESAIERTASAAAKYPSFLVSASALSISACFSAASFYPASNFRFL